MVADLCIVDKEGALHSTKTMGHKMTSFFTGIKKKQSKGSIIKISCNKSVISMSKSRPVSMSKTAGKKYSLVKSCQLRRLVCNPSKDFVSAELPV